MHYTEYFSVSQAGSLLGVCVTTIRRWDKNKQIRCIRTPGGHRRIHKEEIDRIIAGKKRKYSKKKRYVATYARVSSHDQKKKGDLDRQQEKLRDYCINNNLKIASELRDVASGLNTKRKGLGRLIKLVTKGKISQIIINYPDRLTRFGFGYIKDFFNSYGVKITVLEERENISVQQEMVDDMIAIITSFSGKIHGMRGRKKSVVPNS
ncbi:MAG: IS607 family transposase [Candidatus Heimdallarchaeota archaeon]